MLKNKAALKAKIMRAATPAFLDTNVALGHTYDQEFERIIWDWPRPTRTRSGDPPTKLSPRKIDDTQRAKKSRKLLVRSRSFVIHQWGGPSAPYVPRIAAGGRSKNGVLLPARPFHRTGLIRHNPVEDFKKRFYANLK